MYITREQRKEYLKERAAGKHPKIEWKLRSQIPPVGKVIVCACKFGNKPSCMHAYKKHPHLWCPTCKKLSEYFTFVKKMSDSIDHDLEEMFVLITPPYQVMEKYSQNTVERFKRGEFFMNLFKRVL